MRTWAPPEPKDGAFVERVRAEVAEANRRAYEILGVPMPEPVVRADESEFERFEALALLCVNMSKPETPEPPKLRKPRRPTTLASLWPRWKIIAAMWRFAARNDGEPPKAKEWSLATDEHPSFNGVGREFGSWNEGVAAAGFEPRSRGGGVTYWTPEGATATR